MAGARYADLATPDPEFEELVKASPPRLAVGDTDYFIKNLALFRKQLANRKAKLNAAHPIDTKGITVNERTIPTRDGFQMPIRIYKPDKAPEGGSPLVVFCHGGGFCLGDLEGEHLNCTTFAQKFGCVVINVDYRLAPEYPFPACPLDCWDAVKWAAANASELHANPAAGFIVGGTSAGGNIAAVLGHVARDEKLSPPLTGLCLLIPSVGGELVHIPEKYKPDLISREQNKNAALLDSKAVKGFREAYKPDHDSRLYDLFAPPVNFSDLPPMFFQVCGQDPLRDEALIYERIVREENGVKTKLKVYPGMPHGFWSAFPDYKTSRQFVVDTVEGMKWLLDQAKQ